jgi:hypothetical protein
MKRENLKKNISPTERKARLIIGIFILMFGAINSSMLGLLGLIPVATAIYGFCPAYKLLGICSKKIDDRKN